MNKNEKITNLYFSSLDEFNKFENMPRDFGTGDLLYRSEIHTLQAIGKKPNRNLTELAGDLGISKSGVSKFIKKLLDKELVTKNRQVNNKKEVVFALTLKGEIAYKGHQKFSKEMFVDLLEYIDSVREEEQDFLIEFLNGLTLKMREHNI